MAYIARKISRAKWDPKEGLTAAAIPADAVTGDLRTQKNALSFWTCADSAQHTVQAVALALAAAADRLDRIDVVWLARSAFESADIRFEPTAGNTPVADARGKHLDAIRLDLTRLGMIAEQIALAIRQDEWCRFTRKDVLQLLAEAVSDRRVDSNRLQASVRSDVNNELDRRR